MSETLSSSYDSSNYDDALASAGEFYESQVEAQNEKSKQNVGKRLLLLPIMG